MIHCKNWFCARSNNNDYAEVLFGSDAKTTTQTSSSTDTMTTANSIRQQQPANGKISGFGIGTGTGTAMGNNVAQSVAHNSTTATSASIGSAALGSMAASSANATATGTGGASNSCSGMGTIAGVTGTGSHVVTFLDDVPSGSNGVVNTTTRLMNNIDMQQQYDHHTSDDLEALDTEEFLANNIVSSAMLCDDTLPTSKNCYRLVILG